jgi:rhodanese-related sulfurtransferase
MKQWIWLVLMVVTAGIFNAQAEEIEILSLSRNGSLTWTNSSLDWTCRVEWASSPEGPWQSTWQGLTNLVATNAVMEVKVPMFYRVVAVKPLTQMVTNITADAALTLLQNRFGQTNFAILDVRTASEYSPRHIKTALNLDFYSATFDADLAKLDRTKAWFVYCGSGSRSGQTATKMKALGFMEVYNLTVGLGTLAALPGAASYLEP